MGLTNKKFTGILIATCLMAGCQTAQKGTDVADTAFLDEPSDYGSDRIPAGSGGPIGDLFKILAERGEKGQAEVKAILGELNRDNAKIANNAELKNFRKKYGKITEDNVSSLDPVLQAKLIEDFAKLPKFRSDATFMKNYQELQARAAAIRGKTPVSGVDEAGANRFSRNSLLSTGLKEKKHSPEVMDRYLRNVFEQAKRDNPAYATPEGEQALLGMLKRAKAYHAKTGRSIITLETCKNLDVPATKKYFELLDEHIAVADDVMKKHGKVCPEVEAWVAARFQEKLGRTGIGAWTAAEEMGPCGFELPDTTKACRGLASKYKGVVPNDPPKCL